jgi:hypothetical protein
MSDLLATRSQMAVSRRTDEFSGRSAWAPWYSFPR